MSKTLNLALVRKLLALGLNKRAAKGEVENSAVLLFRHLRNCGVSVNEVANVITVAVSEGTVALRSVDQSLTRAEAIRRAVAGMVPLDRAIVELDGNQIVNFGRTHQGKTVAWVYVESPGWFDWVRRNPGKATPHLYDAILRYAALMKGAGV